MNGNLEPKSNKTRLDIRKDERNTVCSLSNGAEFAGPSNRARAQPERDFRELDAAIIIPVSEPTKASTHPSHPLPPVDEMMETKDAP